MFQIDVKEPTPREQLTASLAKMLTAAAGVDAE